MRKNKAITLIALVVTIIVLLILASVSLNLILGEHGIITMAKVAKENMELAQKNEEKALNTLYEQLYGNTIGESGDSGNSGSTQGGGSETPNPPKEETGPLVSKENPFVLLPM